MAARLASLRLTNGSEACLTSGREAVDGACGMAKQSPAASGTIELRGKPKSWYGGATRKPESSGTAGAAPVVVYSHHDGASVDHALIG
jgi:hypothetical protein